MSRSVTTMIDCRWLHRGGPGRVTEHLLRGLAADPPDGSWLLWGAVPPELRWPDAEVVPAHHDPHDWYGQRALLAQPRADRAIWLHQFRPLRRSAACEIGIIYDTIPLRWGRTGAVGLAQRVYYRRVASLADRVVAISQFSRRTLIDDLRIRPDLIDVVALPGDPASVARVIAARAETSTRTHVLYVGRFARHKNLDRLCEAFMRTAFARAGGRLVLVGGTEQEARSLSTRTGGSIDVRARCPQPELEQLLASAAALVQPSLEEGYGLPVAEALAAGIPVAAAEAGALPEVAGGRAVLFDPFDVDDMAGAVDRAVSVGELTPGSFEVGDDVAFAKAMLRSLSRAVDDRIMERPR